MIDENNDINQLDSPEKLSRFATHTGYLQYAATNNIVVLFPQGQWD